jgi:hypothetical protein
MEKIHSFVNLSIEKRRKSLFLKFFSVHTSIPACRDIRHRRKKRVFSIWDIMPTEFLYCNRHHEYGKKNDLENKIYNAGSEDLRRDIKKSWKINITSDPPWTALFSTWLTRRADSSPYPASEAEQEVVMLPSCSDKNIMSLTAE